jgi:DUF305 family protein family protein
MAPFFRPFIRQSTISLSTTLVLAASSLALAHGPTPSPEFRKAKLERKAAINPAAISAEAPFLAENEVAMNRMMANMDVTPTGDVDRDFVAMMVPHHQGAIDMAQAVLRYGHNEQLRRLAQEIIVTQQQEIAAMRLAVDEPLPPSVASPTQPAPPPAAAMSGHQMSHGAMNLSHDAMSHDAVSHDAMAKDSNSQPSK